jgi:hypothetical protein
MKLKKMTLYNRFHHSWVAPWQLRDTGVDKRCWWWGVAQIPLHRMGWCRWNVTKPHTEWDGDSQMSQQNLTKEFLMGVCNQPGQVSPGGVGCRWNQPCWKLIASVLFSFRFLPGLAKSSSNEIPPIHLNFHTAQPSDSQSTTLVFMETAEVSTVLLAGLVICTGRALWWQCQVSMTKWEKLELCTGILRTNFWHL